MLRVRCGGLELPRHVHEVSSVEHSPLVLPRKDRSREIRGSRPVRPPDRRRPEFTRNLLVNLLNGDSEPLPQAELQFVRHARYSQLDSSQKQVGFFDALEVMDVEPVDDSSAFTPGRDRIQELCTKLLQRLPRPCFERM